MAGPDAAAPHSAATHAAGNGARTGAQPLDRTIVTPEGVALSVTLASRGDRAVAFGLDVFFMVLALIAVFLVLWLFGSVSEAWRLMLSVVLVALFLLRNFYFTWFEIRRAGQTLGKRIVGIKVIDRQGGPLRADAVIARNLTREIEVFLPLTFLAGGGGLLDNEIAQIASIVWVAIFALMPLFNRDNLRVGDMVGGTWVVVAPKVMLLGDVAVTLGKQATDVSDQFVMGQRLPVPDPHSHIFTEAQLDIYGIYELQTLEEVLRRPENAETEALFVEVAGRIQTKIAWEAAASHDDPHGFLQDFYVALRKRLETRMLFGERREHKDDA